MKINIKGSGNNLFSINIDDTATVADLKMAVSTSKNIDINSIRLIYSGKILADPTPLSSYGIVDGHTVHMFVSKPKPKQQEAPVQQPTQNTAAAAPTQPPQPQPSSNPLLPPPPPQQNMYNNLGGMNFDGLFQEMQSNPMMQQMMNQMMNQMIENPEMVREMLSSNPMFANNPMMQQIANNPELFAQQLRMVQGMFGNNNNNANANTNNTNNTNNSNFGGMGNDSLGGMFPGLGGMDIASLMNNPMVQQMMQQMANNPEMLREMINSNPMFANNPMMQQFLNNPELLSQQLRMFAGTNNNNNTATNNTNANANPFASLLQPGPQAPSAQQPNSNFNFDTVLLQHLLEAPMLPMHTAALQNAEVQRGLVLIQQGIRLCRNNGLMLYNNVPNIDSIISHVPQPSTETSATQAPHLTPQQRFGPQLETLNSMGLMDNERNIQALIATNGNVNAAIDWIFSHP